MIEKYLIAILNALLVIHNENKAIAKQLARTPDVIDQTWDEMFFGAIKDFVELEGGENADSEPELDKSDKPEQV